MFGCTPIIFPTEVKEGWDYWSQSTSMEPYMKDVQFFRQFNVAWIFSWEYRFKTFFLFPIHCLRFVSTKSNGGLNSKPDYAAKKMWNIFAEPIKRSSHFTICISLRNHKLLQLLPQRRKKVHCPHKKPELKAKDSHKRKRTSLHISRMTQT